MTLSCVGLAFIKHMIQRRDLNLYLLPLELISCTNAYTLVYKSISIGRVFFISVPTDTVFTEAFFPNFLEAMEFSKFPEISDPHCIILFFFFFSYLHSFVVVQRNKRERRIKKRKEGRVEINKPLRSD